MNLSIVFHGVELELLSQRALWMPREKVLILSDTHFGKELHFQRRGVPLPSLGYKKDLETCITLFEEYSPALVCILGDLFHSEQRVLIEQFAQMRTHFSGLHFLLVQGNHDRFPQDIYSKLGIEVCSQYQLQGITCTHHPNWESTFPSLCGHIHPAVELPVPIAPIRVPCFYATQRMLILPAFGAATGTKVIVPREGEQVWAVCPEGVIEVSRFFQSPSP